MKIVINSVLFLLTLGLFYALYSTVLEPITFRKEYYERKGKVVDKLKDIRTSQKLYKSITDTFANNFEDLENVLTNGRFTIIQASGDRDALDAGNITYDTIYVAAKDSMNSLGLNVSSLRQVPFSDGEEFKVKAGDINQQGYDVPVVEVSTKYSSFMGKYAKKYYAKYDLGYDPSKTLKFGNMNKVNLAGNWE